MQRIILGIFSLFTVCSLSGQTAASVREESGGVKAYALFVSSTAPGPGQKPLRFSQQDVARMRSVLTELGGYQIKNTLALHNPSAAELDSRLAQFESLLQIHRDRGEQTIFLFYYSGHAKSTAINLGNEEVNLDSLRLRLDSLPASVKLVLFDACQTGALTTPKGVTGAADFSYNAVNGLNNEGTIVMSSSASNELSQESEELKGSFFTHHLVVGLRGGADNNRDGRVTLSEVYAYVYDHTLVATAKTAVGSQHVTLETNLKSKGEMVLAWPGRAKLWMVFPAPLQAQVLVYRPHDRTIMAEIYKSSQKTFRLAVPKGQYAALVRKPEKTEQCGFKEKGKDKRVLLLSDCKEVAGSTGVNVKGRGAPIKDRWAVEAGAGLWFGRGNTAYANTLKSFGYERWVPYSKARLDVFHYRFSVVYSPLRHLGVVVGISNMQADAYGTSYRYNSAFGESDESAERHIEWATYKLGVYARGKHPFGRKDLFTIYGQAGLGVAWGASLLEFEDISENGSGGGERLQHYIGFHLGVSAGFHINFLPNLGLTLVNVTYAYAPVLENHLEQKHDSGGIGITAGLRLYI